MKILSLNIGGRKVVVHNGKEVETGIYKSPVNTPILLEETDVQNDHVVDRKYHGGIDKACYIYGANHYPFWKEKYPLADMSFGAFGENITFEVIDETKLHIGSRYQLGAAIVEIASSRQPCFKLGIRIGNPIVVRDFAQNSYSGVYLRVVKSGTVSLTDEMTTLDIKDNNITVAELHSLFSTERSNKALGLKAFHTAELAESFKADLKKQFKL
ncbi:MAG: MOSC domain-containing protein YiiM [Flavobacteriales bacterium]